MGYTPFTSGGTVRNAKFIFSNIIDPSYAFTFSSSVTKDARRLIRQLLKRNPPERVGYQPSAGAHYVKQDPFFDGFDWRGLHFRDLCLITKCPLSDACKSYGIATQKGYLPHAYLQRLPSLQAILDRLHGKTSWAQLEPHIDWLHGVARAPASWELQLDNSHFVLYDCKHNVPIPVDESDPFTLEDVRPDMTIGGGDLNDPLYPSKPATKIETLGRHSRRHDVR